MNLVLDTNVVLDWLVFRDPSMDLLERAVSEGRWRLITHQPALDELRRVLGYPQFKLTAPEQSAILQSYQSRTVLAILPATESTLPAKFPRCRDADDQPFLALAHHVRADALVTKDKEVLRLRRQALKFGVTILDPAELPAGEVVE